MKSLIELIEGASANELILSIRRLEKQRAGVLRDLRLHKDALAMKQRWSNEPIQIPDDIDVSVPQPRNPEVAYPVRRYREALRRSAAPIAPPVQQGQAEESAHSPTKRPLPPQAPVKATSPSESAPDPETHSRSAGPRGIAAVREVMRQGGVWNAKQIHEELERRGWVSPDAAHPLKATEAALNRLWKQKEEVERVGRGRYTYQGPPGSPTMETIPDFLEVDR